MKTTNDLNKEISRRKMLSAIGVLAGAPLISPAISTITSKKKAASEPLMNFSLKGKTAIVTGAARGIWKINRGCTGFCRGRYYGD